MNPEKVSLAQKPSALRTILSAGFICGVLDITAAIVVYGFFGLKPISLLQGIAAGLLGARAREGGLSTAALGLFLHFFIAFSAATVYVAVSRWVSFLLRQAVLSGVVYAVAVYFFMNNIVKPLSAGRQYPFSFQMMVIGIVIHIFCVGLPIALVTRRYSVH